MTEPEDEAGPAETERAGQKALLARVRAWMDRDPDPETTAELALLLAAAENADRGALGALAGRFDGRLGFGTAGLRAPLGAGPRRMNRLVVQETTAGLVAHLQASGTVSPVVVIGFDARHGSAQFAADAAAVVGALGGRPILFDRVSPTPVLAFSVLELSADAGIMVTASHNPPADNGYKVYAADGAQIVSPVDRAIAEAIDAHAGGPAVEWDGPIGRPPADLLDRYLDQIAALRVAVTARSRPTIVYTAMHGVGFETLAAAFSRAGLDPPVPVEEQVDPDPDFPTVEFPNPEEAGALDLAIATAERVGAACILANDPDADRLGMAVPDRDGSTWRILRGDEIGTLLADHLLRHGTGDDRLVATTVVSSSLLAKMAAAAGVRYGETLTGFKWLARLGLREPDSTFVFAYEEALGYAVGAAVRDKDGVSAAVVAAEMLSVLADDGLTVHDRLDELARAHGLHVTDQVTVRFPGPRGDGAARAVAQLRLRPPKTVGGVPVDEVDDLLEGGKLPPSDVLVFRLVDGSRLIVRPSGTEPKLKAYLEIVEPVAGSVDEARERAGRSMERFRGAVAELLGDC